MYRLAVYPCLAFLLSACRIEVVAPPEMSVVYYSSEIGLSGQQGPFISGECEPATTCTFELGPGDFRAYFDFQLGNHVDPDYILTGWQQGPGYFPCAPSSGPPFYDRSGCLLILEELFASAPQWFDIFLAADLVFRVQPIVEYAPYDGLGADIDSAIPAESNAELHFLPAPQGSGVASRWYVFDFPVAGTWRVGRMEPDYSGTDFCEGADSICYSTPRIWRSDTELFFEGAIAETIQRELLVEPGVYFAEILDVQDRLRRTYRLSSEFESAQ